MKNIIILLILIFIGFIFPFFWLITYISQEATPISNIGSILAYIILWIIPIIYLYKKKIKLFYLKLIVINILALIWILYIGKIEVDNIQIPRANIAIDKSNLNTSKSIINLIESNKKYNFIDLESFNRLYSFNIKPVINCYYLKWINNNTWFIFSYKYMSKDNIAKYWTEYYIYKNPVDYIISNNEMENIKKLTNIYCFDD